MSAPETVEPPLKATRRFPTDVAVELRRILDDGALLSVLFQPIITASLPEVYGYEALTRGPADSPLHAPTALFDAADRLGVLVQLETICLRNAYRRFMAMQLPGKLFLNVSALTLSQPGVPIAVALHTLDGTEFQPQRVVIEVTEQHPVDDFVVMQAAIARYRTIGFEIAIDDLGAGYSGLRLWSELRPDYVKIDRHFIEGIHQNPVKQEFVRSIQDIALGTKCRVVAEGIETAAEFDAIKQVHIGLCQGYYFGRPDPRPSQAVAEHIYSEANDLGRGRSRLSETVLSLAVHVTPIAPELSVDATVELFKQTPELQTLPVVAEGHPLGVVRRQRLMELYLRQFGRELYGRRPVSRFMDREPIVVDQDLPVERVSKKITDKLNFELEHDFVITRGGLYVGVGRVRDLLRTITQLQIRNARYANPLTLLPGNVPVYEQIDRLLEARTAFVVCYCDLDHFKPFNDAYGYGNGDEVIRKTAQIIAAHIDERSDFLGHIGGDDFIVVFTSGDWRERCEHILQHFARDAQTFYSEEHRQQGGIWSCDRQENSQFFPLLSLSIGAVVPDPERCRSHHDVASLASSAKHQAKRRVGNALFVSRRHGPEPTDRSAADALPA